MSTSSCLLGATEKRDGAPIRRQEPGPRKRHITESFNLEQDQRRSINTGCFVCKAGRQAGRQAGSRHKLDIRDADEPRDIRCIVTARRNN